MFSAEPGTLRLFGWETSDNVSGTTWKYYPLVTDQYSEGSVSSIHDLGPDATGWVVNYFKTSTTEYSELYRYGTLIKTVGWPHGTYFGTDWSSYSKLWFDMKSSDDTAIIELHLEDNMTPYPYALKRNYRIPAGTWVTCEYNLDSAKARHLFNPSDVVSLAVLVKKIGNNTKLYIDNFRLAPASGVTPAYTLVTDATPWPQLPEPPDNNGNTTRPTPLTPLSVPRDTSTLADGEPVKTIVGTTASWNDAMKHDYRGMNAYDNTRLEMITGNPPLSFRASADACDTWRNVDLRAPGVTDGSDAETYTRFASASTSCRKQGTTAYESEVLCAYMLQCSGQPSPSDLWFRRFTFDGTNWTMGPKIVMDRDIRYCPTPKIIRSANGRIWTVWDHFTRYDNETVAAKFSDDNGLTWQHGGNNGKINGAVCTGMVYPDIADYGNDGAAIAWYHISQTKAVYFSYFQQPVFDALYADYLAQSPSDKIPWDRFATGSAWATPVALPVGTDLKSMVGTPDGKVYIAVEIPDAVLEWDGANFTTSLDGVSGMLTRIKNTDNLMLFTVVGDTAIEYRTFNGVSWSTATQVTTEASVIKTLCVPRVSPVNFVPISWSYTTDPYNIRTLRVKVPEAIKGMETPVVAINRQAEEAAGDIALRVYPNPCNPRINLRLMRSKVMGDGGVEKLEIFDIAGKRVKTFDFSLRRTQNADFSWEASEHSTGIYFVSYTNGLKSLTRKIVVMK
ncbi:MAG: T9SS type A sorting domain-containing protein [Fibrobacterota bacterium]